MRAVRFTVEDNGPGFAANILRRAFEPYVTTKPSGTGLGLAMVKKIIDEHGAHIEIVNRSGGTGVGHAAGAAVTIVFRRLARAETADAARVGSPEPAQARRTDDTHAFNFPPTTVARRLSAMLTQARGPRPGRVR